MGKMNLNEEIKYLETGDWYEKIQQVLSRDEYLKLGWAIGDILETLELLRSLTPEPITNADHIRAMSDEELAKYIFYLGNGREYCYGHCAYQNDNNCPNDGEVGCLGGVLKWLQQPVEEDT